MPALTTPKRAFEDIRNQLRRRIGRQWKPGDRLPSIRDLSCDLGTGHVNTHRAVKALTEEGVLVARHRVGVFVAEASKVNRLLQADEPAAITSRHLARPLAGMRVHVMVGSNEKTRMAEQLVAAFEQQMQQHHCEVSRHVLNLRPTQWRDHSQDDCEAMAILSGLAGSGLTVKPGLPLVVAHQGAHPELEIKPLTDFDLVGVDNHHGGFLAGRCLRDAGLTRAVVLGRHARDVQTREVMQPERYDALSAARIAGFLHGFEHDVPLDHQFMASSYSPGAAARLVPQYLALDPRPIGVFAASDDLALGFIHGAQSHGLEPGRDYHIIGFDGQQAGRELHEGPLATIDLLLEDMGRRAADLLAERMINPALPRRQFLIGCKLYPGKTVQSAAAQRPST